MKTLAALVLAVAVAATAFFTCSAKTTDMPVNVTVDKAFASDLETVQRARVFFGHHSVGHDLLAGMAVLGEEAGVAVTLDEAPVGTNKQPLAKFEDFAKRGEHEPADGTQLMVMKLCYVDFEPETDVAALVGAYAEAVARVRKARPGVKVLHVTPPVVVRPTDWKSTVKRWVGSVVWEDKASLRRQEFAERLRRTFPGEPVFDLAAVEATRPDGSVEQHSVDGQTVRFLWPGYTRDGGHLNEAGQKVAAKAFVQALAAALRG